MRDRSHDEEEKAKFLEVLDQNHGNLYATYTSLGVNMRKLLEWREDPEFEAGIQRCKKKELQWVESKLYQRIEEGNADKLIQFYLKTQGRNAGWQEVQKVEADVKGSVDVEKALEQMAEQVSEDVPF